MGFFKRLIEIEKDLHDLRLEFSALKDALDEARSEKNEYKKILFLKFGLIEPEQRIVAELPKPIERATPVNRVLKDLEKRDREWAEKARKVEETLNPVEKKNNV